jgi:hypothetical protein
LEGSLVIVYHGDPMFILYFDLVVSSYI